LVSAESRKSHRESFGKSGKEGEKMNIPDKEIERIAYPTSGSHPNAVGISAAVFLLMGVFVDPYCALLALFPLTIFWTEAWNNIRWAREYAEASESKKWIQNRVDEAVSTRKIDETIEEMRLLQKQIPNSTGGGQFIKNKQDQDRWFEMDRVIDALYEVKTKNL
jgi:hypothetical protein